MDSFSQLIITSIQGIPQAFQIFVIFLFSYAEGLPIIGSILPGGTIALLAGSLSATGIFTPINAVFYIALGSFLGDMTGFFLGKKFKENKFLVKITSHEKYQKSWDLFDRHIAIITIFGKLLPVVRSTPSIFAAVRGVRTRRYMLYSFLGSVLWSFGGVFAGNILTTYLGDKAIVVIVAILIGSFVVIIAKEYIKKLKLRKSKIGE
jgi:membrane protein DedA with SNARE-associated domain